MGGLQLYGENVGHSSYVFVDSLHVSDTYPFAAFGVSSEASGSVEVDLSNVTIERTVMAEGWGYQWQAGALSAGFFGGGRVRMNVTDSVFDNNMGEAASHLYFWALEGTQAEVRLTRTKLWRGGWSSAALPPSQAPLWSGHEELPGAAIGYRGLNPRWEADSRLEIVLDEVDFGTGDRRNLGPTMQGCPVWHEGVVSGRVVTPLARGEVPCP